MFKSKFRKIYHLFLIIATISTSLIFINNLANVHISSPIIINNQTTNYSTISLNEKLFDNNRNQPIYSLTTKDSNYRHLSPEDLSNNDFWKQFILNDHLSDFFSNDQIVANDFDVKFISANNLKKEAIIEIFDATKNSLGQVLINNFAPRPSLPTFMDSYTNAMLESALNMNGYFNANNNFYPFQIAQKIINNNDTDFFNKLYNAALNCLLFDASNQIISDTTYSIHLKNQTANAINNFYETGLYDSLNNAVTGNEQNKPQLTIIIEFENIIINGQLLYKYSYNLHVFNALKIDLLANDKDQFNISLDQLHLNYDLNDLNFDVLLDELSFYLNKNRPQDLPKSIVQLDENSEIIKDFTQRTLVINTNITNVIGENTKPIYNKKNVQWTITNFKAIVQPPMGNDISTSFTSNNNTFSAPVNLANKLIDDITITDLDNLLTINQIKQMFNHLPIDFEQKIIPFYYVINNFVLDYNRNTIKVSFALTYAKVNGVDVYNENGTSICGEFILTNFATAIKFNALDHNINLSVLSDIYDFDPKDTIRKHLISYVNNTTNVFANQIKIKVLDFLNNEILFNDSLIIVNSSIEINATPTYQISVINNQLCDISNDMTFANAAGVNFTIKNFKPYEASQIDIVTTSFDYTYDEFVKEVEVGNIGINKNNDKFNLMNVSKLPNNGLNPIITVSKINTTGLNAKAIVNITFPEFYVATGLIKNYSVQVVVALKSTLPPIENDLIFNQRIDINDIVKVASVQNLNQFTSPLAINYFNQNKSLINKIFNESNVASLLLSKIANNNFNINFQLATALTGKDGSILVTLNDNDKNNETIEIYGFVQIQAATNFTSTLPSGVNFSNINNQFVGLNGDALDKKAKTFLSVTNEVVGWKVLSASVIKTYHNDHEGNVAFINFIISDVYVPKHDGTYTIGNSYLIQFKYQNINAYANNIQGLFMQEIVSFDNTNKYHWLLPIIISVAILLLIFIISLIVIYFKKR